MVHDILLLVEKKKNYLQLEFQVIKIGDLLTCTTRKPTYKM